MKRLLYCLPILGLLVSSCSNDGSLRDNPGNGSTSLANNYISINIVPGSGLGSRAEGDNDPSTNEAYRDGTDSENKVNMVRFFFFAENGDPAPVRATGEGQYESFLDWYPENSAYGNPDKGNTVEKTFKATLGIFVPEGYEKPASVIAVINPSTSITFTSTNPEVTGPSLAQLKGVVANFENGLVSDNFVMSNSAYVNKAEVQLETSLDKQATGSNESDTYFKASIEAALADPVTIYVERVVARLDLWINLSSKGVINKPAQGDDVPAYTLYPLTVVDPATGETSETITIDGAPTKVYIKFLGWNITSSPQKSYLLKSISSEWTDVQIFGVGDNYSGTPWNNSDYHRSFWAMNPVNPDIQFGNFYGTPGGKNIYPANGLAIPESDNCTSVYLQENASPSTGLAAPEEPTKVILACQLVKADGTPIKLAEWGFRKFTIDSLISYLLNTICPGYYKKTTKDGTTTYTSLGLGDVEFITTAQRFPEEGDVQMPDNAKGYYAYLVLKDSEGVNYTYGKEEDAVTTTAEAINQAFLDKIGYSMVWKNGYSYYFFDVRHLGEEGSIGYNGIIRNHIYDTHLNSIVGIGTPVLEPDETIYPEKPEYEESIIAAQINILQWRVVRSGYDLAW